MVDRLHRTELLGGDLHVLDGKLKTTPQPFDELEQFQTAQHTAVEKVESRVQFVRVRTRQVLPHNVFGDDAYRAHASSLCRLSRMWPRFTLPVGPTGSGSSVMRNVVGIAALASWAAQWMRNPSAVRPSPAGSTIACRRTPVSESGSAVTTASRTPAWL